MALLPKIEKSKFSKRTLSCARAASSGFKASYLALAGLLEGDLRRVWPAVCFKFAGFAPNVLEMLACLLFDCAWLGVGVGGAFAFDFLSLSAPAAPTD